MQVKHYTFTFSHRYIINAKHIHAMLLLIICLVSVFLTSCAGGAGAQQQLSGHLLVVGSTALQPLTTRAAVLFQRQHPGTQISVQGGGSISGLQQVTASKSDIGDSDIYADPALYPDPNLTDHIVCVVPFTMIANPDVTIPSLTQQQVIDIFSTGAIHNWQQMGGTNMPIVPVVRPATSGTRATFRKYILDGRDEHGQLASDSSTLVQNTVAHTPGAVGYLALSVLNNSVRALSIDGYKPTLENIEAGHYAFWSYEHMYTLGDNNLLASAFLDFMLTAQIQQVAHDMGYIPIANMKLAAAEPAASKISIALSMQKSETLS